MERKRSKGLARLSRSGLSKNALIGGLAALVLSSFSVLGLYLYVFGATQDPTDQLETAMRLMRRGEEDSSFRLANSVDVKSLKKRADRSKRAFLLGARERKAAESIVQRRLASEKNQLAVKHLEQSRDLAFPDGYEGLGNYYLGMALFDLLKWDDAETPLEIAAERWPQGRADAIERLVDIDISFENKNPTSALARIAHWRGLPRSTANETERAFVKEMQALYVNGEFEMSSSLRTNIPIDSLQRPVADLVHGRCMQRLAERLAGPDKEERLQMATDDFQRVLSAAKTSVSTRRQGNLEMGRVIRARGKPTQAVSAFSSLRLSSPYEPESLVSGLEEIDCLIDLGRLADASDTLEHITKNFGELGWYLNDWMPISDMRKQVVASGERMIGSKAYSEAARFANNLPPFCDELDRLRMRSRLYERWANQELERQKDNSTSRTHFTTAAEAYEALARKLLRTPEYQDLLWRAIENYRMSGAFIKSNQLLENNIPSIAREDLPKGFLVMAKNYNAMEKPEMAMISLNRILESNTNTPLVYDARLEAAKIRSASEDYQKAEELVVQNLYYGDLAPESPIWRESLFLLSDLLFRRGQKLHDQASEAQVRDPSKSYENLAIIEKSYNELIRAIARTEEGLRRFENDPRRLQMLYTMANAYKMASSWPDLLLRENQTANEDTLAGWRAQRKELLIQSRGAFSRIVQEINSTTDVSTSSDSTENLLRNSIFGVADLLYDAGDFEDAIVAYQDAATRFIGEPESLEAMIQVSNAQKKLGKTSDSRRTLERAKDTLSRIPQEKNARFKAVTSHDRPGWEQFIDWLLKDLTNQTKP